MRFLDVALGHLSILVFRRCISSALFEQPFFLGSTRPGLFARPCLIGSIWLALFDWLYLIGSIWPYGQLFFQVGKISIFCILISYLYREFSFFVWPFDQFSGTYPWLVTPKPKISARWAARNSLTGFAAHECWAQQFNRPPGSSVLLMKASWACAQSLRSSMVMAQSESSASSS